MLYKGADLIRDVEFVIFDEVHYVNDAEVCHFLLFELTPSARRCLGGSYHHVARARQYHPALRNRTQH